MKKASYKSAMKSAKKTISRLSKAVDFRGLNIKKNYSSFWMNDEWDNHSKFDGLPSTTGYVSTDLVKLIKLSNYRRAITNFVKIVTNKDIHVTWAGANSYTDGQAINLTTDIKDNNFDVTVGLALHEASHIVLSDFALLKEIMENKHPDFEALCAKYSITLNSYECKYLIKDLLNWIEDRRIDHYIFSTSPGYKAYYHKMYDHYWNDEKITQGLLSQEFRQPAELDSWKFQIINMLNPVFDKTAMPRLDEVVSLIDVRNISRLKSTGEALTVALSVAEVILSTMQAALQNQANQQSQGNGPSDNPINGGGEGGSQGEAGDDNGESQDDGGNGNLGGLSQKELNTLHDLLEKQRKFLNGDVSKKTASQKLTKQLEDIAKQDISTQSVGGEGGIPTTTCLMHDLTSNLILNIHSALKEIGVLTKQRYELPHSEQEKRRKIADSIQALKDSYQEDLLPRELRYYHEDYEAVIAKGFEVGGLLGKKLQLHNESRERVDNRLTTGRMDAKRLAHAGYGIENVFKQIRIDKYKKANLHISIDGSGSMNGRKWLSTLEMTAAIVKAAAYTQGISIQISIRVTSSNPERPTVYTVYDSRKNSLRHFAAVFTLFSPSSMTPEGLCFEAQFKKGMFMEATKDVDSYFLNISDGEPGCTGYQGQAAVQHTARIVNRMKSELNMKVLSFFIESTYTSKEKNQTSTERADAYAALVKEFNESSGGTKFKIMYGRDASVVDPSSALMIARELNKKFMTLAA